MIVMASLSDTLKMSLNEIVSYLAWGYTWHNKAANQLRKLALRGFARWHDAESCDDHKARACLDKLLIDNVQYVAVVDNSKVAKAEAYVLNSITDFKTMFSEWVSHEEAFIHVLNKAIEESRGVSICLYEKLCCLAHEVQNEVMRAQLCYERLELAGWQGHDLGVVSKWLHCYFEEEYDGSIIDFNIG